ncbi:hypothetical protein ABIA38_007621 [Embleya sp. AB8]
MQSVQVHEPVPYGQTCVVDRLDRVGGQVQRGHRRVQVPGELVRADRVGPRVPLARGAQPADGRRDGEPARRHQLELAALAQVPGQDDVEQRGPVQLDAQPVAGQRVGQAQQFLALGVAVLRELAIGGVVVPEAVEDHLEGHDFENLQVSDPFGDGPGPAMLDRGRGLRPGRG